MKNMTNKIKPFILHFQMNKSEKPQPPDPPDDEPTPASGSTRTRAARACQLEGTAVATKKAAKKKTVTFKNVLETSDDLNIVKKEPNPYIAPPVPIIKKECLTRAIQIARGGKSILLPSRLTEIVKNNSVNNIDKLNSLTFKSSLAGPAKSKNVSLHASSVHFKRSNDEDNEDDDDDDEDSSIESEDDDEDDVGERRRESDGGPADETDAEHLDQVTGTTGEGSCDNVTVGDKRFILPKRSVHSARVIKPNKRFLDAGEQTANTKNGKKVTGRKKTGKSLGDADEQEKNAVEDNVAANALSLKIDSSSTGEDEAKLEAALSEKGEYFYDKYYK